MAELVTANRATQEPVNLFGVGHDHAGGQGVVYLELENDAVVAVVAENMNDASEIYEWGPFGRTVSGVRCARLVLPIELPAGKIWELTVEPAEASGSIPELRRLITT